MKKIFTVAVIICVLVFSTKASFAQETMIDESDFSIVNECRQEQNSCSVIFLQAVLCNFRSYLCLDKVSMFSWGLLATIHAPELDDFTAIDQEVISAAADTKDAQLTFINHEVLEYMICTLEGDICVNGSFYTADADPDAKGGCIKDPKSCSND